MGKRGNRAVDLCAHAMVAHLRVHGVGKVQRRSTGAQAHHLALGGEDKDLLVEEVDLERMQKLLGIVDLVGHRPIKRALEPVDLVIQALGIGRLGSARAAAALVEPVRRDAVLCLLMHLKGADLDLERARRGTDDRGVQRLVVVELGHGDIVLEAARHGVPQGVDRAQSGIAIAHGLGDDAKRHQIVDLGELLALALHLLIDGPIMLGASLDLEVFQAHALEFVSQRLDGLGQITLANLAALGHHAGDALIRLGLQIEERKVFELPLYGRDAQAVCQRSVDVHGLACLEQAAVFA